MKQITDLSELTVGTQIVRFFGDQVSFWEYLCLHPKNSKYILLLEDLSKDAIKQYIPNLLNSDEWYIDYTFEDIWERQRDWHLKQAKRFDEKIKNEQSKKEKESSDQADQES